MSKLLQDFKAHWATSFSHLQGKPILLAVSGGADSMVLAHLFRDSGITFGIAHCNFGLRAHASDLDEEHVANWCTQANIPFHTVRFDTKQHKEDWKKGTQETARILRYDWFERIRRENDYARIATAHHANDNVETLLINLFKGTGINGMHGIFPENGKLIRPLLFATKEMLSEYVVANNVLYREDESNAVDDYLRNAVRHQLVPVVTKLFPNAIVNVNESISRFAEAGQLFNKAIAEERKKLLEQRGKDYYIPIRKLQHRQPLATICYELLQPFGFTSAQLPHVLCLLQSDTGRFIASPTHRVIRNRDFLVITTMATAGADIVEVTDLPCVIETEKYRFSFSVKDKPDEIPAGADTAFVDMDSVTLPLVLRRWRTGDYFYPLGMGMKKKKVSRLLIDQKVPLHEKENIRILECNKRIVWVSGIRLDERFKVKPSTATVLIVKMDSL
ncbi:MAG: tRNA lysidine(34) synthetase TilS [Taibaiella sp.]|nr:tRNA lysidine(34) synthetase TilS [Taibaiella sp.]